MEYDNSNERDFKGMDKQKNRYTLKQTQEILHESIERLRRVLEQSDELKYTLLNENMKGPDNSDIEKGEAKPENLIEQLCSSIKCIDYIGNEIGNNIQTIRELIG